MSGGLEKWTGQIGVSMGGKEDSVGVDHSVNRAYPTLKRKAMTPQLQFPSLLQELIGVSGQWFSTSVPLESPGQL